MYLEKQFVDRDRQEIYLFHLNCKGSEAAAATAVIMLKKRCIVQTRDTPIEFKANRPFLFFIQEKRQNLTLFTGKFYSNLSLKH